MVVEEITPTNLYKGIDKEIKFDIDKSFAILANIYNNYDDNIVRSYIANNFFAFMISIISDEDKQQELIDLYNSLE